MVSTKSLHTKALRSHLEGPTVSSQHLTSTLSAALHAIQRNQTYAYLKTALKAHSPQAHSQSSQGIIRDPRAAFQKFEDAARKKPIFVMPPYFIHSSTRSSIGCLLVT